MIPHSIVWLTLLAPAFSKATTSESRLVDAMADKSQWTLVGQRVSFSLGNSKLEVSNSPARSGATSVLKLTCDFGERGWSGIQWRGSPLLGRPERVSFWLHGDGSKHKLVARMEDAAGNAYQAPLGPIAFQGWREITVPMNPASWTPVRRQGDLETPIRWPVTLREIRVMKANDAVLTPTVAFSELRAVGRPEPMDHVQMRLSCNAPAHVFYEGEPVRVQAQIKNPGPKPVAGRLEAVVCDWLGREQRHALGALEVNAGQTHEGSYDIPVRLVGSYTLWLRLAGDAGIAEAKLPLAVSRHRAATAVDLRSPMGMGLYLPRFRDDKQLDLAFQLAREAGVKWTRSDLRITEFQPEPGHWAWDGVVREASPQGNAIVLGPHVRIKVADSESLNRPCATGELTMAMRLRLNSLDYSTAWPSLLSKSDGNPRQWSIFWSQKARQLGISIGDGKSRWSDCLTSKPDWEAGRWYNLVVAHRRADRSVQWWIDGRPAGTSKTSFPQTLVPMPIAMTIGGGLKCSLDDLAIYDRWVEPSGLASAAPVAHWTFDEGKGAKIADRTGNKNDILIEPWRYDGIFARTRQEGISTYCILASTPKWMTEKPSEDKDRPGLMMPRLDDWSAAVEKIVTRQKEAGIRTWEVWNEPNIKAFWSPEPNAADYARLLIVTYKAIKRADPEATVLGCGLAGPNGAKWRPPYEFVEEVLKHGGGQAMDAISIHPYRQPRAPEESGYVEDLQGISDLTAKYGRRLPMWITEVGWPTDPSGSSESRSAQLLARSYLLAIAHGVRNVAWYDYHDDGTDPSYNEHHFGILYHDMTPKPPYFAYRTMATELAGMQFEREAKAGDGASLLVFGDGQRHAAVAWSHRGAKQLAFRLANRQRVEAVDLMGNPQTLKVADGALLASVDETPIFLRDLPDSLDVVRPIEASPAVLKLLPGEQRMLEVVLRNPFTTPLRLDWGQDHVELASGAEKRVAATRNAENWAAAVAEPWRSAGGVSLILPAQVVILDGQREPIFRHDAEVSKTTELPDAAGATATDELTVMARFRSDGPTGTWQALATKWGDERRNWGVFLGREKGELSFSASFAKGPGSFQDISSEHSLFDGRWHRVAVTYSAHDAEICFFVDGNLIRRVARDGGKLLTNHVPVRLAGGFIDGRAKPAKTMAAVGQVQVWNRALSAEEIQKLGGR